jgi:uncharacterized integral membrane protein (TIGR00698 family)
MGAHDGQDAAVSGDTSWLARRRAAITRLYPGSLVALVCAIAAAAISARYGAPEMLIALLIGLAGHFLYEHEPIRPGIDWVARGLLRFGVALLGLRIVFADVLTLGFAPLVIVAVAMVASLLVGVWVGQAMGLTRSFGALSGGAVAVCGVSAAAAITSVLPERPGGDREMAVTVAGVTTLSTIAMIFYPVIVGFAHLSPQEMGVVLGGSIHDVAQVVGAGYSISREVGDKATFVKLMRVCALLPMVMVIHLWIARAMEKPASPSGAPGAGAAAMPQFFPPFLIAFFALAAVNSAGLVPAQAVEAGKAVSHWALVVSIAGIGIKTDLRKVVEVGWKPFALMALETAVMLAVVLGGLLGLRML